MLKSHYPDTL